MNLPSRRHFISDLIQAALAVKVLALIALAVDFWEEDTRELELSGVVTDEENNPLRASSIESGSVKAAMSGRNKIFVIRDGARFHGLSRKCTHKSCTVKWDAENKWIRCPCHGSRFALSGDAVKGPAKRPLQKIGLKIEDDRLIIDRTQEA